MSAAIGTHVPGDLLSFIFLVAKHGGWSMKRTRALGVESRFSMVVFESVLQHVLNI